MSLLFSKNVHPKFVQELLGHASVAITLDTYSHMLPGMDGIAADALADALGDAPEGAPDGRADGAVGGPAVRTAGGGRGVIADEETTDAPAEALG